METVAHYRKLEEIYNLGTIQAEEDYRTRAIIARSWFETALEY